MSEELDIVEEAPEVVDDEMKSVSSMPDDYEEEIEEPSDEDLEEIEEEDSEEDSEEDENPVDEQSVELELSNGEKVTVPKEVADGYMKNADYTQKTQQVAETRKALAEKEEAFSEIQAKQTANFQLYTALANLDEQLKAYNDVDWVALAQQDHELAKQHQFHQRQLHNQRQEVSRQIEESEKAVQEQANKYRSANIKETADGLKQAIADYAPEIGKQITSHAIKHLGVPQESMQAINRGDIPSHMAVPFLKAAHDSMQLAELKAKQGAVAKRKPPVTDTKVSKPQGTAKRKPNTYSKNLTPEERIKMWQKRG